MVDFKWSAEEGTIRVTCNTFQRISFQSGFLKIKKSLLLIMGKIPFQHSGTNPALWKDTICEGAQPLCKFFFSYFVHHQPSHKASVFNMILSKHSAKPPFRREGAKRKSKDKIEGRMNQKTKRGNRTPNHREICKVPPFCDGWEK